MKFILGALLTILSITAQAKMSAQDCPASTEEKYGTTVIRTYYSDIGLCSIGISPRSAWQTLTYRDFSIASDGLFMVFNTFGSSGEFGVRDFMLFPRTQQNISYSWNDSKQELNVIGVTGDTYTFDANTAQIKSITGASKVSISSISTNNKGGVEIQGYKGQVLDIGYATSKDPSQNKEALSIFTRAKSSCKIKNSALFNYYSDGDIQFKFETDKAFQAAIKTQCR